MNREDLRRLFAQARELCGETDYVVLGSLAILGHAGEVPARMAASVDVDAYCKHDLGRVFDLAQALGPGSPFEAAHGYYLDPISPRVATLPEAWEARLLRLQLEPELVAWFLEPNDAAVSKYARMEPRDRAWLRPGLQSGVLSLPIIAARFGETTFFDAGEAARARQAIDQDRAWLARRRPGDRALVKRSAAAQKAARLRGRLRLEVDLKVSRERSRR